MLALAILFLSGKLLRLFSYIMGDKSKGFEFIQNFLLYSKKLYLPIILFALLFVLMQVFEQKLAPHYPKKTILTLLIILTAVEKVAIHFGKPDQRDLDSLTAAEARKYIADGEFAPGSMLPKVEAAVSFVRSKPGRRALITLLEKARDGISGHTGTMIHA
jgi:hypothetical protein